MKKHDQKTAPREPAIEPPCPECAAARAQSGRTDALCARHAERHAHGHAYHYERELPLRQHDSNVIPTGVPFRR